MSLFKEARCRAILLKLAMLLIDLVAPKLKFGGLENRLIYGQVAASFANSPYIVGNCKTPISTNVDPDYAGSTCIEIEHAGQAYVPHPMAVIL